jgi:adenosylcobinamide kinase/adenosylcobinamide-phosphate guanylyltransferase
MAKNFILILGGARSGKSTFAQSLAAKLGKKVLFVATGEPLDEEMASRIEEHRRRRPKNWRTLEITTKVGKKLQGQIKDADVVLLDCIALLVSNILTKEDKKLLSSPLMGEDEGEGATTEAISQAETQVMAEMEDLLDCIDKHEGNFIVISNEVGLGLVPDNKLGRIYRDLLGKANQLLAQYASEVYLMVSGIPVKIKG